MIVEIDSMPLHLVEYLFIFKTDDVEFTSEVPVLLNEGLAIQDFEGEDKSKSTLDYYLGNLSYFHKRRIAKNYEKRFEVTFSDLVTPAHFGSLVANNKMNIEFFSKIVVLTCGDFTTKDSIENLNFAALRLALKVCLQSDTATVSPTVMDVMNQYTAQLAERNKKKIVLH